MGSVAEPDVLVLPRDTRDLADRLVQRTEDFVALLEPDTQLLDAGLDQLRAPALADSGVVAVHGIAIPVGPDGSADREAAQHRTERHVARLRRHCGLGYLTVFGDAEIGVSLYRRDALLQALARGAEHSGPCVTAVGESAGGGNVVLRDPPCFRREGSGSRRGSLLHGERSVHSRLRRHRRLARRGGATALPLGRADLTAVAAALEVEGLGAAWRRRSRKWVQRLAWKTWVPLRDRLYDLGLAHLSGWRFRWGPRRRPREHPPARIGYYLWRFPVLSETFILRELRGLREAGIDVHVIADGASEVPEDPELDWMADRVHYLLPLSPKDLLRDLLRAALRHPFRLSNLLAYTIFRPYQLPKSIHGDLRIFLKSVRLAGLCRELGIEHLHAPWGDLNAFFAMLAARQVDAGFSVQFRAHDLHRRTAAFLLAEKIRHADFVITNTEYNRHKLEALSPPRDHAKLRRIYNGLPLQRFDAKPRPPRSESPIRLLCVARLIEPKGLVHLLGACRALADRGVAFRCLVIGGPELPSYVNDLIEIRLAQARLGLGDLVEFAGAQPFETILAAYRDADIFVLPCVRGGDGSNDITPNTLLEAMAMRLPVVATTSTALPELVEDGVSGLLVPPGDAEALEAAILRLIDDAELGRRLGQAARQRIEERFDVEKNVCGYTEAFGAAR